MGSLLVHHVMEEGEESALFDRVTGGGENIVEAVQIAEIITNNILELMETEDSNYNVPTKIADKQKGRGKNM